MGYAHKRKGCCFVLVGMTCCSLLRAQDSDFVGPPAPDSLKPMIDGIVLNHYGGGIAEATVRAESLDASATDEPLAEVKTNDFGEFKLTLPSATTEPVRVRIRREGYVEHVQEVDASDPDEPPFVDTTLEGAHQVTGTIYQKGSARTLGDVTILCENGGREMEAQADENGAFRIENVAPGSARLTAIKKGYGTERTEVKIEDRSVDTEFALAPERPVRLTVISSEGVPAENVYVEAYVEPTHLFLNSATDEQGKAELSGINAEAVRIHMRVNGEGYVQQSEFTETIELLDESMPQQTTGEELATRPAEKLEPIDHRLVVKIAAVIRGRVVDATDDKPVVGVRVIAGREVSGNMPMTWTNLNGEYELGGLPPGITVVSFQHDGFATAIKEFYIDTGKTTPLDMQLEKGKPVSGVVLDADKQPLDQVYVTAEVWNGYSTLGMRTITGTDGTFAFAHMPEGETEFSFVRPGYGPMVYEMIEAGRNDVKVVLEEETAPEQLPQLDTRIAEGAAVPDFTVTTTDGTTYKLSKLRGKYVFVDCWATWCGPCVGEIPNIRALYEATKDRADFVLIGVSLDNDREAFNTGVEKHDIDWPQVFGPKSGARETFELLDGVGLPYTCLIGPDGKMLGQHFRGPDTPDRVKQLMAK